MLQNVPANSVAMSATYLAKCVIFIRERDKENAKKSFDALLRCNDYDGQMLPLLIKEAQEARLVPLATLALQRLLELDSNVDQLLIIRTVLKLQIDDAELNGGFQEDTCRPFLEVMERAVAVAGAASAKDPSREDYADIITWIFKVAYNVSHEEKHLISPQNRLLLCERATQLFESRLEYAKAPDVDLSPVLDGDDERGGKGGRDH
jgi:hypothetical protein